MFANAALEQLQQLPYIRATLAESLRLYPQPPILIRRALGDDTLPPGLRGPAGGFPIGKVRRLQRSCAQHARTQGSNIERCRVWCGPCGNHAHATRGSLHL